MKAWILAEFKGDEIDPEKALNEKLRQVPQEELKRNLREFASVKSPYAFMVVYYRTMERYESASVEHFATELSKVMARFELKNQQYLDSKSSSEDKFARLNNILALYTEAKVSGRLPKNNLISLRVTSLKAHTPGLYSIDIRFESREKVVATNVKVDDANVECMILNKPPFECEANNRLASFSIALYDNAGELVSQGNSWIFQGFSRAEPFPLKDTLECTSSLM